MHKLHLIPILTVAGLLLFLFAACDYTGPQGGTLDVHLSSTDSDLQKAVVTIEHMSVAFAPDGHEPENFGQGLNMIDENIEVDLASLEGSLDTLLARHQVLPAEFNQLHLALSDTARISYQDSTEGPPQKVALPDKSSGEIVLNFGQMHLRNGGETASIRLGFNLDQSFVKSGSETAYRFEPDVAVEKITVNGRERARSR